MVPHLLDLGMDVLAGSISGRTLWPRLLQGTLVCLLGRGVHARCLVTTKLRYLKTGRGRG